MSKFVVGVGADKIFTELHKAGVIDVVPENTRRVIIDLEVGTPARVYVESFLDRREPLPAGIAGAIEAGMRIKS